MGSNLPANPPLPAPLPTNLRAPLPEQRPPMPRDGQGAADNFSSTQAHGDCVDGNCPRPLVMFIGGAMDDIFGPVKKDTYPDYKKTMDEKRRQQWVHYATHKQTTRVARHIEENYDRYKRTTCIVGHSWGGNTALKICRILGKSNISIRLFVTLDPFGVDRVGRSKNIVRWINIYVNYNRAKLGPLSSANRIAKLGRPYEFTAEADENIEYPYYEYDAHTWAVRMFYFVRGEVKSIR